MKSAFLILPFAISLSACAQEIVTADLGPCPPATATPRSGGSAALLGSGINSNLLLFARDDNNPGRIVSSGAGTAGCERLQTDKNKIQPFHDFHKIGDGPASPGILLGSDDDRSPCSKIRG